LEVSLEEGPRKSTPSSFPQFYRSFAAIAFQQIFVPLRLTSCVFFYIDCWKVVSTNPTYPPSVANESKELRRTTILLYAVILNKTYPSRPTKIKQDLKIDHLKVQNHKKAYFILGV
jgi:hypothetical protein